MADNPYQAPNSGAVGMPAISPGMNKIAPANIAGGKGAKNDARDTRLGSDRGDDEKLLERARRRMNRCIEAEGDNRRAALEDLKFYNGDQWPASIKAQREFDKRPCHTINKLPTFVKQVTNDVRQNRPSINVSPVGDRGDPEVAKMYAGMIREIERKSVADIAYDTAFASAARGGWGYWRVLTEYEKPGSFNLVATIRRVRNPFNVYLDPAAQEPEGADAKWGFVSEMLSRDEFRDEYPDADPMPWTESGVGDTRKTWITKDEVRVAEYFEVKTERRRVVMLENGVEGWEDELSDETLDRFPIIAEREANYEEIWQYKLTAVEVLEKARWPGKWIPIIRVIGDEVDIEGKVTLSGIVRHAKDPQRAYNYWTTAFTEMVALAPKAPFIMAEGQEEGHEGQWKNANVRSFPYLLYKPVSLESTPVPPPARQAPIAVPQGIEQARQDAAQDMMAVTGIRFDATPKERMYDESGRALRELRRFGDLSSFDLVDNLARAQRHTGEILVDLIPKIYDRKRVATILRENDAEERVMIDPGHAKPMGEMRDPDTNKIMKIFNPSIGEYGVTVTIGPSYATKRIEAAESMMDFLRAVAPAYPQAVSAVADLVAKYQDWPGSEEFHARLTKLLAEAHPGMLTPDIRDVPPQIQALLAATQRQIKTLTEQNAIMQKALADTGADRAQRDRKIELDFEAKVLGILQKSDAARETHIGAELRALAESVKVLHESLMQPEIVQ